MSGLGPERFYAGRQLVYQDNAAMNESERQAALVDQMRRQEMLRRNDPARRAPIPEAPGRQAGLQMPAPVAAPAAPVDPNAARRADSARFMDMWNGGIANQESAAAARRSASDGPQDHFSNMLSALPQLAVAEADMNANQRQQWNLIRNAYGRLTRREISPQSYRRFLENGARAGVIAPQQVDRSGQSTAQPTNARAPSGGGGGGGWGERFSDSGTSVRPPQQATRLGAPQQATASAPQGAQPQYAGRAPEVAAFLRGQGIQIAPEQVVRSGNSRARGHNEGNSIDVSAADAGRAMQLIQQQFPGLPVEAVPVRDGEQFGVGADGQPVTARGNHVHFDFGPVAGGQGGGTPQQTQPSAPAMQQIFQAAASGPQGTAYAIQQLNQQRSLAAERLRLAQQVGDTEAINAGFQAVYQFNAQIDAAEGVNAAMGIGYSGNTEAWSQYFTRRTGHQLTFQPYSDGSYEIVIDGTVQGRQTREELTANALTMVNDDFAQRTQARQDSDYEAERDSRYRRLEAYETALFRGMTDVEVARIRAEAAQRTGSQDVEFQDIGEGKTIAIYTNASGQRVASLVAINPRRSPTTGGGRGEERDVLEFGPETAWGQ